MKTILIITILLIQTVSLFGSTDRRISSQERIELEEMLGGPTKSSPTIPSDYYPATELTSPPKPIVEKNDSFPVFSPDDRWAEIELMILLSEEGEIETIHIINSPFQAIAIDAVLTTKEMNFEASEMNNQKVKSYFTIPIHFNIDEYLRNQNKTVDTTRVSARRNPNTPDTSNLNPTIEL